MRKIIAVLRERWSHISAERGAVRLGSGQSLSGTLHHRRPHAGTMLSPADVTDHAIRGTDATCVETFRVFCAMLGTVAGNLAVTVGATGGSIWPVESCCASRMRSRPRHFANVSRPRAGFGIICARYPHS